MASLFTLGGASFNSYVICIFVNDKHVTCSLSHLNLTFEVVPEQRACSHPLFFKAKYFCLPLSGSVVRGWIDW